MGITHSARTVRNTKIQKAKSAEQQEQVHKMIYSPLVRKREKVKMDRNYHCKVNVCEVRDGCVKGTLLFTL
jgi:hypothetical protein